MSERLYALLTRIAVALEAQADDADETMTFPLSDFASFAWSSIGASPVQRDSDGVSVIRTAAGRLAKRRSNDKFGTEIWFSYSDGKDADGTPKYRRVIEFKEIKAPEPLGRKTEQAVRSATIIESPLMGAIRKRWADLSAEYLLVNKSDPIPERFSLSPGWSVPENQRRTDEFEQFVAGLKMVASDHEPAKEAAAGSWAAKVAALKPQAEKRAEIRDVYEWLFAIAKKANEGVPPYDTMPASLADAIARCADMAKIADAAQGAQS